MTLVAPDILEPLTTISPLYHALGVGVGLLLWLLGGWGQRFWLVLATTLVAGICGLIWGPDFGMQPLVAGLFLGIALGTLAMSLVRILMFVACGLAAAWVAQKMAPSLNETVATFLVGGVVGVLLFRVWMTILTSFVGSLLVIYNGLALVDRFASADAVAIAAENGPLFNWGCVSFMGVGLLLQYILFRRGGGGSSGKKSSDSDDEIFVAESDDASSKRSWQIWPLFGSGEPAKKAG